MGNANNASILVAPTAAEYYEGPAGFMGGGASFVAAAAFSAIANTGAAQHIVGNREDAAQKRGWSFYLSPTSGPGVELNIEVGNGASMINKSVGGPPLGELILVHLVVAPGADQVKYYVQGNVIDTGTIAGVASPLVPTALTRSDGTAPGGGVQLLGFGYGVLAWADALAVLHYQNCQRVYDFARLTIAGPELAGSDFDNRYSVRDGANVPNADFNISDGSAGAPIWTPSSGTTDFTRVGDGSAPSLNVLTNPKWLSVDL